MPIPSGGPDLEPGLQLQRGIDQTRSGCERVIRRHRFTRRSLAGLFDCAEVLKLSEFPQSYVDPPGQI